MKKIIIMIIGLVLLSSIVMGSLVYLEVGQITYKGYDIDVNTTHVNISISDGHYIECTRNEDGTLNKFCFFDMRNCLKER